MATNQLTKLPVGVSPDLAGYTGALQKLVVEDLSLLDEALNLVKMGHVKANCNSNRRLTGTNGLHR